MIINSFDQWCSFILFHKNWTEILNRPLIISRSAHKNVSKIDKVLFCECCWWCWCQMISLLWLFFPPLSIRAEPDYTSLACSAMFRIPEKPWWLSVALDMKKSGGAGPLSDPGPRTAVSHIIFFRPLTMRKCWCFALITSIFLTMFLPCRFPSACPSFALFGRWSEVERGCALMSRDIQCFTLNGKVTSLSPCCPNKEVTSTPIRCYKGIWALPK